MESNERQATYHFLTSKVHLDKQMPTSKTRVITQTTKWENRKKKKKDPLNKRSYDRCARTIGFGVKGKMMGPSKATALVREAEGRRIPQITNLLDFVRYSWWLKSFLVKKKERKKKLINRGENYVQVEEKN